MNGYTITKDGVYVRGTIEGIYLESGKVCVVTEHGVTAIPLEAIPMLPCPVCHPKEEPS